MSKHKGKRCTGEFNDFFFEEFDKGMDLPRHPIHHTGSAIVVFTLVVATVIILTHLGVI